MTICQQGKPGTSSIYTGSHLPVMSKTVSSIQCTKLCPNHRQGSNVLILSLHKDTHKAVTRIPSLKELD